jgi:hypothetical protein
VALNAITPIIAKVVEKIGPEKVRSALPVLRELREQMDESN